MSAPLTLSALPFSYQVRYSRRRTLALYVYPDQRVELRAPHGCPAEVLQDFLAERSDWVQRKLLEFSRLPPPVVQEFSVSEPQPFLGTLYPLTVTSQRPYGVWLAAEQLLLRCRQPADAARLLADWYRRQAGVVLAERLEACLEMMARFDLPRPGLRIRRMRRRWGSCSSRGDITLNLDLVRYPLRLIDYVIVHELCHLREFHHGPAFYRLMDAALPDWPARKQELRELAATMPPWPEGG
jgi:predicted metal-dependent hydrolase